jgi:hypothetical protein
MEQQQIEVVGKVFVVVGGNRKCLVCEGMFTPAQAANHATVPCYPTSEDSEWDEGTLDPCSPFLPPTDSSSSQGQA